MSTTSGERMMTPVPEAVSTEAAEPLTPAPSGESSVTRTPALPMSPPRGQQSSVPSSPAPHSADRSPAMTPTQQQRINVFAPPPPEETGVVLGLEQLERQQDEAERRRREQLAARSAQQTTQQPPQQRQRQQAVQHTPVTLRYHLDDDTAPSSAVESASRDAASHTGDGSLGSGDDASAQKDSTKFSRMIKNTKKRLSSNDFLRRRSSENLDDPADDDDEGPVDAIIYGHLQKLGRNGKWQTRWFESDGECLSYYKSSKRTKLLATLDLEKVGAIVVNEDDPKGCSFTIQVLGRPYYLRAESRASCKDWVITLNRVKEAKMQQGNVKLVHQAKHLLFGSPPDLLDRSDANITHRIAIENPHRPRTRAVDGDTVDNIEEMLRNPGDDPNDPATVGDTFYSQTGDSDSLSQAVLASWQKRKSSMSRLASKLGRWARSLKKYRCSDVKDSDVWLDRHVHPPGHDNMVQTKPKKIVEHDAGQPPKPKDAALTGWIGKETSLAAKAGPVVIDPDDDLEVVDQSINDPVSLSGSSGTSSIAAPDESVIEEDEPRELS